MSVRARLAWMVAVLTLLPALPAVLVTRAVVGQVLVLSAHDQMDQALEAGVRGVRTAFEDANWHLRQIVEPWVTTWYASAEDLPVRLSELRLAVQQTASQQDRVELVSGDETIVLQSGPPVLTSDVAPPLVLDEGEEPMEGVPWRTTVSVPLDQAQLRVTRLLPDDLRMDAARVERGLQMVRALGAERSNLAFGFWAPFLLIYSVSVAFGVAAALLLGNRLTGSVKRLVHATDRVAAGDWEARVSPEGSDELGVLGSRFNAMVSTLDAQSRRLIDLETMAGWREMARALAHEVKNPLTPIQLTVEEIRQRYRGEDKQYRELLEECTGIVVEEVESLRRVVERFREFSRPVELRPRALALNELLHGVGALQRGLSMRFDLDEAVGDVVVDEDRLRQVMLNLLENARSVLDGREDPTVHVRSRRLSGSVEVLVEDNGPGIPEEERDRVFEPYRTGRSGGLGLGLSLVKGIVLAHGGSIDVDQGNLGGAAFRIVLPVAGPEGTS